MREVSVANQTLYTKLSEDIDISEKTQVIQHAAKFYSCICSYNVYIYIHTRNVKFTAKGL